MSANAAVINSDGGCPILCATQNCCAGQKCKALGLVYPVLTCVKGTSELRGTALEPQAGMHPSSRYMNCGSIGSVSHRDIHIEPLDDNMSWPSWVTKRFGDSYLSALTRAFKCSACGLWCCWPGSGYAYYYGIRDGKLSLLS
ncbi:hypothetical protein EDD22DRAFT_843200 [Suillus occidentalis]|nr:hypothetical protein EDD22DRAFT_843200 [Suillus occidentalis]